MTVFEDQQLMFDVEDNLQFRTKLRSLRQTISVLEERQTEARSNYAFVCRQHAVTVV